MKGRFPEILSQRTDGLSTSKVAVWRRLLGESLCGYEAPIPSSQKEIICESGLAGLGNFGSTGEAMMEFGKILVFFGVLLLVLGALFLLLGRTSLPIGRLPGDILYRGKNTTFYFPFTTSILLSAVLSLVLYVIGKFKH